MGNTVHELAPEEVEWWIQVAKKRVIHFGLITELENGNFPRRSPAVLADDYRSDCPDNCWGVGSGWIYAATFEDDLNERRFIKIGYAKDPAIRKAQLAKTWGNLSISWKWPASVLSENEIHNILTRCRVPKAALVGGDGHTEWFLRYPVVDQICAAFHVVWNCAWDDIDQNIEKLKTNFGFDDLSGLGRLVPHKQLNDGNDEPEDGQL